MSDLADFREWMDLQRRSEISHSGGLPTKMLRLADTGLALCERLARLDAFEARHGIALDSVEAPNMAWYDVAAVERAKAEKYQRISALEAGLLAACSHLDAHAEEYQHVTPRETRAALRALAEGKDT